VGQTAKCAPGRYSELLEANGDVVGVKGILKCELCSWRKWLWSVPAALIPVANEMLASAAKGTNNIATLVFKTIPLPCRNPELEVNYSFFLARRIRSSMVTLK
jgi:hypothetical protein